MPSLLSPPPSRSYTPLADEPPFGNTAPTNGTIVYSKRIPADRLRSESEETLSPGPDRKGKGKAVFAEDDGDIGQIRRVDSLAKGKGRAWDVEQGIERFQENEYPPQNEETEEERRVQDNLAKFAARDMARRRAARLSRQLPPSTTSFMRRPFSMLSSGSTETTRADGEPPTSPQSKNNPYNNPYDVQPTFSPTPKMVVSPGPSPFADQSPLNSPTEGFTYGGPSWRGGEAAVDRPASQRGGDKWWHALCAWGEDLDGGFDGDGVDDGRQAGRTNPFE
ncbi:hypothetical protein BCR39DRAFT_550202 [Naematelia encephala]|uniref:Uncharacterized protein n=1 Tax=Naematelia encephala TaxID=71784 RepID=A0A1Y2AKJ2_9TREE|nr:hypothetical protein BCR39DRAFT_550202 [Naematelia encephala]